MSPESSRPEMAFVLMLMQATFWFGAGASALPFVLAGEPYMAIAGALSFALAAVTVGLAAAVVQRRQWARRAALVLEVVCLAGAVLQQVLPIGANHGPVALLVNIALPAATAMLLRRRRVASRVRLPWWSTRSTTSRSSSASLETISTGP